MKYKSIEIKNFKGVKNVTVDFTNNRILTIVGLNESGKTTILEGIQLFFKLIKGKTLKSTELNQIRPKGIDFTGKIEITANLNFENSDFVVLQNYLDKNNISIDLKFPKDFSYTYSFEYSLHKYESSKRSCGFDLIDKASGKRIFDIDNDLWQNLINHTKSALVPEILYYEDFIFQIPEEISFPISEHASVNYDEDEDEEEWKLVLDDILKSVSPKFTSFQDQIASIWETDNDTARQRINAMESKLDTVITKAWKELFEDKKSKKQGKNVKKLNFKEIKIVCNAQNEFLNITFKVKTESGKEFSINERSKGFKWFFSFLIFTEFRKKRTRNTMFLLDEPASNLHSSAQSKILNAIQQLSDESIILYSTHSHHMINPEWLTGAYVVINDSVSEENLTGALTDTEAKITLEKYFNFVNLTKDDSRQLYYQPILDVLEFKPSSLEVVKNIIICEGKYDWYTFNYVSKCVFKDKYNYHFYPGAGRDNQNGIIRLYLSWGSPFTIILDGDKPGQKSREKYIKEFEGFLEDKIYTLKDILGLECVTEGLFTDMDQKNICDTAFGSETYESVKNIPKQLKSKFNFAIIQLLNKNKSVELSESATVNFKRLFDFCKKTPKN